MFKHNTSNVARAGGMYFLEPFLPFVRSPELQVTSLEQSESRAPETCRIAIDNTLPWLSNADSETP